MIISLNFSSGECSTIIDLMEKGLLSDQQKRVVLTEADKAYDDMAMEIIAYIRTMLFDSDPA